MIQVTFWYESAFNWKPTFYVLISNQCQIEPCSRKWLGNQTTVLTLSCKKFVSLDERSTDIFMISFILKILH